MTEAGKRLLAFLQTRSSHGNLFGNQPRPIGYRETADESDIAAIEAEAVAAERARIRAGVDELADNYDPAWLPAFTDVLAIIGGSDDAD